MFCCFCYCGFFSFSFHSFLPVFFSNVERKFSVVDQWNSDRNYTIFSFCLSIITFSCVVTYVTTPKYISPPGTIYFLHYIHFIPIIFPSPSPSFSTFSCFAPPPSPPPHQCLLLLTRGFLFFSLIYSVDVFIGKPLSLHFIFTLSFSPFGVAYSFPFLISSWSWSSLSSPSHS